MAKLKIKITDNKMIHFFNPDGSRCEDHPTAFYNSKLLDFYKENFEIMDLFEQYTEQPKNLAVICDKWSDKQQKEGLNYKDCKKFLKEVESIGFTFDYGLSAEPFNLRKTHKTATKN